MTKAKQVTPKLSTSNSEVEHDAICMQAQKVVQMWQSGEETIRNADAMAVYVIVRAHEFGFFSDIDVSKWHTIVQKSVKTSLMDTIIHDLFGIEKPTAVDRQRLSRIQRVVPAVIRSGGMNVISLSKNNALMLSSDSVLFQACGVKSEVDGNMAMSVAKLDKGARKLLAKELPKSNADTGERKDAFKGVKFSALAKEVEKRIAGKTADTMSKTDVINAKHLLVHLLGVFGATSDGGQLDTDKLQELYQKDAA